MAARVGSYRDRAAVATGRGAEGEATVVIRGGAGRGAPAVVAVVTAGQPSLSLTRSRCLWLNGRKRGARIAAAGVPGGAGHVAVGGRGSGAGLGDPRRQGEEPMGMACHGHVIYYTTQDRCWAVLPTSYDTALREPGHRHEASTQPHIIPSNLMQYLLYTAQLRTCIAPIFATPAHMQTACSGREDCAPLHKSLNLSETCENSLFEERYMFMDGVWSGSQAAEHGQSRDLLCSLFMTAVLAICDVYKHCTPSC